jgi:hypothetical protein
MGLPQLWDAAELAVRIPRVSTSKKEAKITRTGAQNVI